MCFKVLCCLLQSGEAGAKGPKAAPAGRAQPPEQPRRAQKDAGQAAAGVPAAAAMSAAGAGASLGRDAAGARARPDAARAPREAAPASPLQLFAHLPPFKARGAHRQRALGGAAFLGRAAWAPPLANRIQAAKCSRALRVFRAFRVLDWGFGGLRRHCNDCLGFLR